MNYQPVPILFESIEYVTFQMWSRCLSVEDVARPSIVPGTNEGVPDDSARFTAHQDFHLTASIVAWNAASPPS